MRLDVFLTDNRDEIIDRCRFKEAARNSRTADSQQGRAIITFLDQLIGTLRLKLVANPDEAGVASRHGSEQMYEGATVAQLVHDYGDVCQSVTELAIERGAPIANEDFRVLNRCLDDAIADAVTEFARLRELKLNDEGTERLGILAHEMRNLLGAAVLAFDILKSGGVGVAGATGAVLERSLARLGELIDRSLADVRLEAGTLRCERVEVRRLLEEIEITASSNARAKGVVFSLAREGDPGLAIDADPQILAAIVVNLVQNAIKFTPPRGHVVLRARATAERVAIEVADECGGLGPGATEALFRSFEQQGTDRSGLGLGLTVARRGAEAHGGNVFVRDVPGIGCVFTLELPRASGDAGTLRSQGRRGLDV